MAGILLRLSRIVLYLGLTLPLMPLQALFLAVGSPLARHLPRAYHRLCWRILGFRVEVKGSPSPRHPTLFAANHVSYTDITILAGIIRGSFIAKTEVAHWPLFGQLAQLQRTIFIDRRRRSAKAHEAAIARRLASGEDLILFPEGTSGDGTRVLPFKSALFGVAGLAPGGARVTVQPVSIAYTALNGMPMGRAWRPLVAWYGDMELGSHLWAWLGLGTITVKIEFHAPLAAADFASRKSLAEACRRAVAGGLAAALSGRETPTGDAAPRPLTAGPVSTAETVAARV